MILSVPQTPALVLDSAVVEANIGRLAKYCADHRLGLRPHAKTHKSRKLAAMQLAAGAIGLTVAKVGEAEVMAGVAQDLLLAFPAVDAARVGRVANLARTKTMRVAIDSREAATALAEGAKTAKTKIGVLVDLDVGLHRTGMATPAEALALAEFVATLAGLRLDGLFCYPGQIISRAGAADPSSPPAELAGVAALLEETITLWKQRGLQATIVSGGSTPTAYDSATISLLTEIRPGTYVFNDMNTVRGAYCSLADCAARVVATVVSTAVPGQVVLDAGSKTLAADRNWADPDSGHGHVVEYPESRIVKLSEEHAQVDVRGCLRTPKIGERVSVIPNHVCPCVNLQDSVWWRGADGRLEPLVIDARGRLS